MKVVNLTPTTIATEYVSIQQPYLSEGDDLLCELFVGVVHGFLGSLHRLLEFGKSFLQHLGTMDRLQGGNQSLQIIVRPSSTILQINHQLSFVFSPHFYIFKLLLTFHPCRTFKFNMNPK